MSEEYIIRPADDSDCMSIFNLSNDPIVRANSIHSEKIDLDQHKKWFQQKIHDKNTLFYVAIAPNNDLIGQIRFSKEDDFWVVSISIDKNYRNQHLGTKILQKAMDMSKQKKFVAFVQKGNEASKRMFLKLNYKLSKTTHINDKDYEVFSHEQ